MIAQVYVDTGVPHLDRPFDYAVDESMVGKVQPGIRVRVPFAHRVLPGIVVSVSQESDQANLLDLDKVVSEVVVVPPASMTLLRAVADHCAGGFMDMVRLAVPPRVAKAEKATLGGVKPVVSLAGSDEPMRASPLDSYPLGQGFRSALREGKNPRTTWTLAPTPRDEGNWAQGFASLAHDTLASGRRVLIIVPDAQDCSQVLDALSKWVDKAVVSTLSHAQGAQGRYSSFLRAISGQAQVIVGTRAAVYTPMEDLGLIAVWEESDSSLVEKHFPYPSLRDVVALRVAQESCGVVFASYSRSVEIQGWVEKGWLNQIQLPPRQSKFLTAQIRVASSDDRALDRDAAAKTARLPQDAFTLIRKSLTLGPVLVCVPWVGNRRNFLCSLCRGPMRCACGGGFEEPTSGVPRCQVCATSADRWECSCGGKKWRAITIGSARTAEELATSFRQVEVLRSDSTHRIETLGREPRIVIATPGCEPTVDQGYAAAVLMDASGILSRPDIRAGEEAVRSWLRTISLVKPGQDSGSVLIIGPNEDRTIQSVVRLDPVGFAQRELGDRRVAGFPPATRMATFLGDQEVVEWVASQLGETGFVESIGPVGEIDSQDVRLIARVPADRGEDLAYLVTSISLAKSTKRKKSRLTWRLDPTWLGG
jgi:primosomal protein N' (replication factor Y)